MPGGIDQLHRTSLGFSSSLREKKTSSTGDIVARQASLGLCDPLRVAGVDQFATINPSARSKFEKAMRLQQQIQIVIYRNDGVSPV